MIKIVLVAAGAGILGLGREIRSDQSPYADGVVTTATMTSFHTERSATRRRTIWTNHYRPACTFQITVGEPSQLGRTVELSYRTNEPGRAG